MVTWSQLLGFGLAALVIIVMPGPSVLFVVGRALSYGRTVALLSVLGNSLGLLVVMVLVSLGLGALVAESVLVFTVVKLVGAAYLVWLGIQAIRHGRGLRVEVPDEAGITALLAVRQGFLVGVANPKAFMMFAAVLPQFVDRSHGQVTGQLLTLGCLAFLIGLLSDGVWALLASRLRDWINGSAHRGRGLATAGGVSMIGLGVALVATGHPD